MTKNEIKKALKAKGLCPVDLAIVAGVLRSIVSHVMAGRVGKTTIFDLYHQPQPIVHIPITHIPAHPIFPRRREAFVGQSNEPRLLVRGEGFLFSDQILFYPLDDPVQNLQIDGEICLGLIRYPTAIAIHFSFTVYKPIYVD